MTMSPARDLLVTGLRNAHGMEVQARELMQRQCDRLGDYPAVQTKLRQHLAETIQQLRRLAVRAITPPLGMASRELSTRLTRESSSSLGSTFTGHTSGPI